MSSDEANKIIFRKEAGAAGQWVLIRAGAFIRIKTICCMDNRRKHRAQLFQSVVSLTSSLRG